MSGHIPCVYGIKTFTMRSLVLRLQTPMVPESPVMEDSEATPTANEETVYLSLDQAKQLSQQVRQVILGGCHM